MFKLMEQNLKLNQSTAQHNEALKALQEKADAQVGRKERKKEKKRKKERKKSVCKKKKATERNGKKWRRLGPSPFVCFQKAVDRLIIP